MEEPKKRNTNSNSPASKAARLRTAMAYNKRMVETGQIKRISLMLKTPLYEELKAERDKLGLSRPDFLRLLLDCYKKANNIE